MKSPPAGRFVHRAKPSYIGGILEMSNARFYGCWGALTAALRTGRPQSDIAGAEDALVLSQILLRGCLRAKLPPVGE